MTGAVPIAESARRSTSSRSTTEPTGSVPYADAARSLLQRTIVDAVDRLVRARGWAATTMADVAASAGVSRQTVYNEFGSRQALVGQYVSREIEALVDEVEVRVRAEAADPRAALRAAFALFLRLASDEPVVQIIVADTEGGELIRMLTDLGRSIATSRVVALITDVWPQVAATDAEIVAESLVRLAISHALLPTADPERTADDITRLIGPFVEEVLGPAG